MMKFFNLISALALVLIITLNSNKLMAQDSKQTVRYSEFLAMCQNFSTETIWQHVAKSNRAAFALNFSTLQPEFSSLTESDDFNRALNDCFGNDGAAKNRFILSYNLADFSGKALGIAGYLTVGKILRMASATLYSAVMVGLITHISLNAYSEYLNFKKNPKQYYIDHPEFLKVIMAQCKIRNNVCIDPRESSEIENAEVLSIENFNFIDQFFFAELHKKRQLWMDVLKQENLSAEKRDEALKYIQQLNELENMRLADMTTNKD